MLGYSTHNYWKSLKIDDLDEGQTSYKYAAVTKAVDC